MYRALYRKYRPRQFRDVVGQEAITTALANQIVAGKVGHAYMFTGTRGTGKTTCAKLFARAVNCENPSGAEPCGECVVCAGLENGSILDVEEIDAASNNGVDNIRDLRDETAYRPSRCRYKVYIIDEVHMLSIQAFNALLKIMEEPPSHVIFILATTEIHKVPATILSRCQRYDFLRIPAQKIAARLHEVAEKEGISLSAEAADLIARLADGALRDGLSLLDTCSGAGEDEVDEALVRRMAGVADKAYLFAISDAAGAGDVSAVLGILAELREKSIDVKRLTEELIGHYRNFLLASAGENSSLLGALSAAEAESYRQRAAVVGRREAIFAIGALAAALDKMGRSPDPRIELELALFHLGGGEQPPAQPQPGEQRQKNGGEPPIPTQAAAQKAPPPQPVQAAQPPMHRPAAEAAAPPEDGGGGVLAFEPWPQVVAAMQGIDRMLYSYMKSSAAYFNGRHVLIDGGDMFISYMKDYPAAGEKIKNVIEEVCGTRYPIGGYKPPEAPAEKKRTADDTLREWEQKGVPIEYE